MYKGRDEKLDFLIDEFCEDSYEREEMRQWIEQKGIVDVYELIIELFYQT